MNAGEVMTADAAGASATFEDFVPAAVRAELFRPIGEALGLPGDVYGEAFHALERQRIFTRRWVAIAVGATLPDAGDVVPVERAGHPLILVRGRDATVRCFHNICRHRAMRVVAEPCKGRTALHCPWHGWTYELDGRLRATPNIGGDHVGEDPAFHGAALGLVEVPCRSWMDLLFVNLDGSAPPFEEYIAPLVQRFAGYDLSGLRYASARRGDYDGNWKVFVEGAIENYHVPFAHPQLDGGERTLDWRHEVLGDCAVAMSYRPEFFRKPGEGGSPIRQSGMPRCPRTPPGEGPRNFLVNVFPTALFILNDYQCLQVVITPEGSDRIRTVRHVYFFGDGATAPEYESRREAIYASWDEIMVQDRDLVLQVQRNSRVRDAAGIRTRFSPYWEASVHEFQKLVVRAME